MLFALIIIIVFLLLFLIDHGKHIMNEFGANAVPWDAYSLARFTIISALKVTFFVCY